MMSAIDMFNQFKELAKDFDTNGDTSFTIVYMDKDGNMTKMSSDDVKSEKIDVPKPIYDKTFYQALKELHTCKDAMYIEERDTKVRISIDDDGDYDISRISSTGLFINKRDMNSRWYVKYACPTPDEIPNTISSKPNCSCKRDSKGRFVKND